MGQPRNPRTRKQSDTGYSPITKSEGPLENTRQPELQRVAAHPDAIAKIASEGATVSLQNKVEKLGVLSATTKERVNSPRLPRNSARSHHPKTTFCAHNFAKPHPKNHQKNYLPSRSRAARRSGKPAIRILPCAAVRSYGTR